MKSKIELLFRSCFDTYLPQPAMSTREAPTEHEDPHSPQGQLTTKRQKQSQITTFFASAAGTSTDDDSEQLMEDEEEEDNHDDKQVALPNVEIVAIIYAYCEGASKIPKGDHPPWYDAALHGKPVYVGQTMQDLLKRDRAHFCKKVTKFDRQYTNRSQYILVMLDQRRFAPASNDSAFIDDTLRPAAEWMDVRERKYITEFTTYLNGLNATTGGQRGFLVALREAKAKHAYLRFLNEYMPAFRVFYEKHGHVNAPCSHPILGRLLPCLRSGHTPIPIEFEEDLMTKGLDMRNQTVVQRDKRWEEEYMPTFREFYEEHGHVNAPRLHPVLKNLLSNIRSGHTPIPIEFEDELLTKGLDMRNQTILQRDKRWEQEYMPSFREFYEEHGHVNAPRSHPILGDIAHSIRIAHSKSRTHIPAQHEEELLAKGFDSNNQTIIQRDTRWAKEYMPAFRSFFQEHGHVNAQQSHPDIGKLVSRLRRATGETSTPPQHEEELLAMGLDLRNQHILQRDVRWNEEYMPAFRAFYEEHGHINVASRGGPYRFLSTLVNGIRSKNNTVPVQHKEELRDKGLFWCTKNLANHVITTLGRPVTSLKHDIEASEIVMQATEEHARILTIRANITGMAALKEANLFQIPFGLKPLGDGVARFNADLALIKGN
jgi:hypothetical protein